MPSTLIASRRKPLFRSVIEQSTLIGAAQGIGSGIGLATVAITARGLGPEAFGVFVLVQAFVSVVGQLVDFRSWQAFIKYGAEAIASADKEELLSLAKFCALLDAAGALAGFGISVVVAMFMAAAQGWDTAVTVYIGIFASTLLFHIIGAATGILRLFDDFRILAYHMLFAAGLKLAAVGTAFLLGSSLLGFVIATAAATVAGHLLLVLIAYVRLKQRGFDGVLAVPTKAIIRRRPDIWGFVWTTNLNSVSMQTVMQTDVLIVGHVMGPVAAGGYRIIRSIGSMISNLTKPIRQVIFPTIARLIADREIDTLRRLANRFFIALGVVAAAAVVVVAISAPWVLNLFGSEYVALYWPAVLFVVGMSMGLVVVPITPIFLARGWHKKLWMAYQSSSLIYILVVVAGATWFGMMGVVAGMPIFYVTYTTVVMFIARKNGGLYGAQEATYHRMA